MACLKIKAELAIKIEAVMKKTMNWKNMKNMQYLERNRLFNILEGILGSYKY